MINIIHTMQHVVECPTWEHSHPNRCWVSKWEHGYLNRCSFSKMGTWLSKSMFNFSKMEHGFPNRCWISHMGTWFAKSMLDFQNGNMVFQTDVGCQFTHWVQTMVSNMMRCTNLEDIALLNDAFPLCPPPSLQSTLSLSSRVPPTASWQRHCWPST